MQANEKRKAGQQHQPATENARTDARRGKKGPNTAGCPKPEEEAAATTHPTGHKPDHHNGGSPRKAGQWPEQLYTGPVQKRALYTRGPKSPKGDLTRYTRALYKDCHANMRCTHEGRKAEKVSSGGERPLFAL